MNERVRPTRSGLFTIELLIAVGVFTLCAAICTGLFVRAEIMSRESEELNRAVNTARSIAEDFKASGGDIEKTAKLCGGELTEDLQAFDIDEAEGYIYDAAGLVFTDAGGVQYILAPHRRAAYDSLYFPEERLATLRATGLGGEELFAWEIAAIDESASLEWEDVEEELLDEAEDEIGSGELLSDGETMGAGLDDSAAEDIAADEGGLPEEVEL